MSVSTHRAALTRDGFVLLPGSLSAAEVGRLRAAVAANEANDRPRSKQVLYTHAEPPPDVPPLSAIVDQWLSPHRYEGAGSTRAVAEAVRPIAEGLLDGPVVLFQDLLLVKRPGHQPFPWHQDFGFWPLDRPHAVILWAPLQPAGPRSGGLRFASGSHHLGPRPVIDLHDGRPQQPGAELGFDPDAWPIVAPDYAAGDLAAFTPLTFHGSPSMGTDAVRAAWSCIFLAPDVRWSHANAPNHPLCRVVPDGAPVSESLNA